MPLGGRPLNVTFYGVRGSTPCSCNANSRYGGNTSSVVVEVPDAPPILLDLGTGPAALRREPPRGPARPAVALVTHLHWDHVQGLPFFGPVCAGGAAWRSTHRHPTAGVAGRVVRPAMRPPYFPVHLPSCGARSASTRSPQGRFDIGEVTVTVAPSATWGPPRATGSTGGVAPWSSSRTTSNHPTAASRSPGVLELADGGGPAHPRRAVHRRSSHEVRLGPFHARVRGGGGRTGGRGMLALFHHDPAHDDDFVDAAARPKPGPPAASRRHRRSSRRARGSRWRWSRRRWWPLLSDSQPPAGPGYGLMADPPPSATI